jgi:hemerythrin-like domain-containing protein
MQAPDLIIAQPLPPLIERLGRDHQRISRINRQLARECDSLASAEGPDWQKMADLLHFLRYYADQVHHPLEDRLVDRLLHKGLTPTERHLVFRNLGQHEEITAATERIARQIELSLGGGVIAIDELAQMLDDYLALQRKHMRFEETHLFPLLVAQLDSNDWNILQKIELPDYSESDSQRTP